MERRTTLITQSHQVLEHLNPKSIMGRGYAALTTTDGMLITSTEKVQIDDSISIILQDGKLTSRITKIERK
jgi:exonuclease VII large subunit